MLCRGAVSERVNTEQTELGEGPVAVVDTCFGSNWSYAHGKPESRAVFEEQLADFQGTEELAYQPGGGGEHIFLLIRKVDMATIEVVKKLARYTRVRMADIGYAGLKDKKGICTQWFSIYKPGKEEFSFSGLGGEELQVIQQTRSHRKIKRGTHKYNYFRIHLRRLIDDDGLLEERLRLIEAQGVPNYFGEQRFGTEGRNVQLALELFRGRGEKLSRFKTGLIISSARSWIFNEYLSSRVAAGSWNKYLSGDVMSLDGSNSVFVPERWDTTLEQRLKEFDIHPSGPLWGRGEHQCRELAREQELATVAKNLQLSAGLESLGLKHARRSLRVRPGQLHYQFVNEHELTIEFRLPAGSFATAVLRELCDYRDP